MQITGEDLKRLSSHPVTMLCDRDLWEMNHEGLADAFASELWPDKEIF